MNEDTADRLARKAVATVSASLADDAEFLAKELETKGLPLSGPDALRMFAAGVRRAAELRATLD